MTAIDNVRYKPVGMCIYCGSRDDLTREHIVPLALDGTTVLPEASCRRCAAITGSFEQDVLRGPMWAVRVYRGLKSRTRHRDALKTYPLVVRNGSEERSVELAAAEYPILLHFPIFAPPGVIEPDGYTHGIRVRGLATISFGPRPEDVARTLGVQSITYNDNHKPAEFARMIAKIAYALSFAQGEVTFEMAKATVIPAILGQRDDIGKWVGTLPGPPLPKRDETLHRIELHEDREPMCRFARVQLFADSETPTYVVILDVP